MVCGKVTKAVLLGTFTVLAKLVKAGTGCNAVVEVNFTVCVVVLVFFLATFLLVLRPNSHNEANRLDL